LESTVTEQSKQLDQLHADAQRWRADWKAQAGTENSKVKEFVDILAAKAEKLSRLVGERDGAIDLLKTAERRWARDAAIQKALAEAAEGGAAAAATILRLQNEAEELDGKLAAARAEAVEHRAEREKVAVHFMALQAQLVSAGAERVATEEALDEVSEAYEQAQQGVLDAVGKLANKDGVLGSMALSLSEAKSAMVQMLADKTQAATALTIAKEAAVDSSSVLAALQGELEGTKAALGTAAEELLSLRASKVLQWATLPPGDAQGSAELLVQGAVVAQRDALQQRVDGLLKQLAGLSTRESAAVSAREDSAAETELLRRRVESLQAKVGTGGTDVGAGGGLDKSARRELKDLRDMVMCPVKKTAVKSAVLRQCGHGMCKEALEQRMRDRLRRCPVCNKGFSADDVVDLHLGSM
jgi:chromosome segregation ATPase